MMSILKTIYNREIIPKSIDLILILNQNKENHAFHSKSTTFFFDLKVSQVHYYSYDQRILKNILHFFF